MAKKSKKPKKKKQRQSLAGKNHLRLVEYKITYDPLPNPHFDNLPDRDRNEIVELHNLVATDPSAAIPRIERLIRRYPKIPMLFTLLCGCYERIGEKEKAESVAIENYQMNPDYLFAKINYAQLCLQKGDLDKIPEIFCDKYDLSLIYPDRRKYHVSEYLAFAAVIGEYLFRTDREEAAHQYLKIALEIAPEHPLVKRLERIMNPSPIQRMLDDFDSMRR